MTDPRDFAPPHLRPVQTAMAQGNLMGQQRSLGHSTLEEAVTAVAQAATDRQATDIEAVANWMNKLRHLDLKAVIHGMFGDTMPKDLNEAIDKAAEWAEANNFPKVKQ